MAHESELRYGRGMSTHVFGLNGHLIGLQPPFVPLRIRIVK